MMVVGDIKCIIDTVRLRFTKSLETIYLSSVLYVSRCDQGLGYSFIFNPIFKTVFLYPACFRMFFTCILVVLGIEYSYLV